MGMPKAFLSMNFKGLPFRFLEISMEQLSIQEFKLMMLCIFKGTLTLIGKIAAKHLVKGEQILWFYKS